MSSRNAHRTRWIVRAGQVVLVLAALRLVLAAAVPIALRSAAQRFGLEVTWSDLSLSLATGKVEMSGLEVRQAGDGSESESYGPTRPFAQLPYLLADVHVGNLLLLEPHVERVDVDGLVLVVDRRADGTFVLEENFPVREWLAPRVDEAATDGDEPGDLDLALPFRLDALRVQRAVVRVRDASVAPPVDLALVAHLRVSDLGRDDRPASIAVQASALDMLDAITFDLGSRTDSTRLHLGGRVSAAGLRPGPFAAYLRALGIRPACERVSLDARFEVEARIVGADAAPRSADGAPKRALAITASVEGARLLVDEREHAALDRFEAAVERVDASGLRAKRFELRGVRGRLERLANGHALVAGLEVDVERMLAALDAQRLERTAARTVDETHRDQVETRDVPSRLARSSDVADAQPGAGGGATSPARTGDAATTADAPPVEAPRPYALSIDELEVLDARLALIDRAVEPAVDTELVLASFGIENLSNEPERIATPARISASASARGIVGAVELDGLVVPFGAKTSAELSVTATGITPRAIDPWLRLAGLETTLVDASFAGRFAAAFEREEDRTLAGKLSLDGLTMRDGAGEFGVRSIEASGVRVAPSFVHVGALEVRGTRVPLAREANGAIAGLGVRTTQRTRLVAGDRAASEPARATSPGATPAARVSLPRLEIERLAVLENAFTWTDRLHAPPVEVAFQDCGFELHDLALFGDAGSAPRTATFHAWSHAADLVREFDARGTLATRPGPFDATLVLDVESSGITALRLKPYIDPTGVEEQLRGAGVRFHLETSAKIDGGKLEADLALAGLDFTNAGASIASLGGFALQGLVVDGGALRAKRVAVEDARFAVARDPVGALLAAGLRIPISAFRTAEAQGGTQDANSEASQAPPAEMTQAQALLATLPDVEIERIEVRNAELAFDDASRTPAVSARARLDLVVDGLATKRPDVPARFDVAIAVPGSAERIAIAGTAALGPDRARLEARTSAQSLRAGALAAYLPEGLASTLVDGSGAYSSSFEVSAHPLGGITAELRLADVELRDAGIDRPLFALRDARIAIERADPAAHVWDVAVIAARGLEVDARRTRDGAFEALGFRAAPTREPRDEQGAATTAAREAPPRSAPRLELPEDLSARLGALELELSRLTFVDEQQGADARPLELAGTLGLRAPFAIAGADPGHVGPLSLRVSASAAPLAREVVLDVECAPFTAEPSLALKFAARGLRGAGVTELAPSLAPFLDGSGLADGVATGGLAVKLAIKKRRPLDLDLRGGFGAHVALERCELRASDAGELLAALDGVEAAVERIDLATGDVHIASVEVRTPMTRILRDSAGIHAFGFVLDPAKLSRADAASAAGPATDDGSSARALDDVASTHAPASGGAEPLASETSAPSAAAAPLERSRPTRGEIRIDELTLRGLDLVVRDTTSAPETVLPLTDLQVEVRKLTTLAWTEPRSIAFEAFASAGKVPLRARARADNVVAGVFGAVGDVLEGKEDVARVEERPVFEDAAIAGRIALFPHLSGHVQADLGVLELPAFEGTARSLGLVVGDGVFDGAVRARFKGDARVAVDTTLVFSDLSLDEPKSGPIETYLSLPVPLDTVLFLLRNDDGEHRIPVSFTLTEDGVSAGAIATAAAGAAGSVIASAVAAAPVRVLSTFTDLFGGDGGEPSSKSRAELAFAPASAELPDDADATLAPLVQRLRDDDDLVVALQHRFGAADVERARAMANPDRATCLEIVARGRQRRAELARQRAEVAAEARAAYALGREDEGKTLGERLRALDAECGVNEAALDGVLALLQPGAERHADKRTRSAALAVGRARLERLRQELERAGFDDAATRIELRSPAYDVAPSGAPGTIVLVTRRRQAD